MSKKNKNPYNVKSNYGKLFGAWKTAKIMTRSGLMVVAKELGMGLSAASATVTVILSPRKSDDECRGDCRGNMSNPWGHLAYSEPLRKKAGEEQKFMFRWRVKAMAPHKRVVEGKVEAQKSSTKVTAKSPAKSKAQAKATV